MDIFNNVNLNWYKSFYYVTQYGGFTKATEKILLSEPSLSYNLKNLILYHMNTNTAECVSRSGDDVKVFSGDDLFGNVIIQINEFKENKNLISKNN